MKKLFLFLLILFFVCKNSIKAQSSFFSSSVNGNQTNIREYVKGFDFDQAMDSSYIAIGTKITNFFVSEFFLYHFTKTGTLDWVKIITSPSQSMASAVIGVKALRSNTAGLNAGYIAAFSEGSTLFVFKMNSTGAVSWAKEVKQAGEFSKLDIEPVYAGPGVVTSYNIIGTNFFTSTTSFIQLSATGSLLLAKKLTNVSLRFHGMIVSNTGGWLCMGEYASNNKLYPALMHLNSSGVIQWCQYYKLSNDAFDNATCINRMKDGYILGLSYKKGLVENFNAFIKTDFNGAILWANHYNYTGANSLLSKPASVAVNNSNEIAVSNSDRYNDRKNNLMKLSPAGTVLWARDYSANPATEYFMHGIKSYKGFAFLANDKEEGTSNDESMRLINTSETGTTGTYCNANTVVVQSYTTPLKQSVSLNNLVLSNIRLYSLSTTITATNTSINNVKCLSLPQNFTTDTKEGKGTLRIISYQSGIALQVMYNKKTETPQNYSLKVYTKEGQLAGEGFIQNNQLSTITIKVKGTPFLFVKLWHNGLPESEQKIRIQ